MNMRGEVKASTEPWIEGRLPVTVYYEDTDFSGYVYHANYLKFFERGREELIGTDFLRALYERGFHFVVGRLDISYHKPAKHADKLEIVTRMRVSESPITLFEHSAMRDGEKLVTAVVKLVGVDAKGEPMRMPADVLELFKKML